jgi:hypothetical protein
MVNVQRCVGMAAALAMGTASAVSAQMKMTAHDVATGIRGGYQVVAADLNRDGRPDLIALGAQMPELVWYENPGWERHVITTAAARMINMDVADTDGDGIPEIGLAYEFGVNPANSLGKLAILAHAGDPQEPWTLTEIDAIPSSHRVRWADIDGSGRKVLVNAPILGAKATGFADPDRNTTPLVYYRPGTWTRETITLENVGVVHGLLIWDWDGDGREEVTTAGRLGVYRHRYGRDGTWTRTAIVEGEPAPYPDGGSSDLGAGRLGARQFFTAIEPFHGNQVVVYREDAQGQWRRQIIDTELQNGHSMVVADLDGDGNSEIVAGGTRGGKTVYLYRTADATGERWERTVLDADLAANGCAVADFDADGVSDVACIDNTSPWNLRWYEHTP